MTTSKTDQGSRVTSGSLVGPLAINLRATFFELTRSRPLDSWNEMGTLFFICSHVVGSRTMLRMFCGRSGGAAVDFAVCRDDCGLGTGHSAALSGAERDTQTAGVAGHGGCVVRGLRQDKASRLRLASRRASVAGDRSPR